MKLDRTGSQLLYDLRDASVQGKQSTEPKQAYNPRRQALSAHLTSPPTSALAEENTAGTNSTTVAFLDAALAPADRSILKVAATLSLAPLVPSLGGQTSSQRDGKEIRRCFFFFFEDFGCYLLFRMRAGEKCS